MKIKSIASLGLITAVLSFTACNKQKRQDNLSTALDSVSYALGVDTYHKVAANFIEANNTAVLDGFSNAKDSTKAKFPLPLANGLIRNYFMKKQTQLIAKSKDSTLVIPEDQPNTNQSSDLLTAADSVSYAIGIDVEDRVFRAFGEINKDLFAQGYNEATDSTKTLIEKSKVFDYINDYYMKRETEVNQKQALIQYKEIKEAGEKFLAENKAKDGVTVTGSGLQYEVLKSGSDNKPVATDAVTVHYHGTTPEGEVFDSSVERGSPATFKLNQVIKGWTEGLQLMGEGAKYKFYIPQELAYGPNGAGAKIKPFMPLVFEVELISINK